MPAMMTNGAAYIVQRSIKPSEITSSYMTLFMAITNITAIVSPKLATNVMVFCVFVVSILFGLCYVNTHCECV